MTHDRRMDAVLIGLTLAGGLPVMLAEVTSDLPNVWMAFVLYGVAACAGVSALLRRETRSAAQEEFRGIFMRGIVLCALAYSTLEIGVMRQVPVIALGHFVTLLCAAKMLDLNSARDRTVVVTIAMLLMVIGAMVSGSVIFGVVLLAYLTIGVWWLVAFRVDVDSEAAWNATRARLARDGHSAALPVQAPNSPAHVRGISLAYGGVVLVVVVLTFLLLPRDLIRARLPVGVPASVTGFTAQVGLNDLDSIIESDQPVLRVRLRRNGLTLGGEDRALYLRGVTLHQDPSGRMFQAAHRLGYGVQLRGSAMHTLSSWARRLPREDMTEAEIWLEQINAEEPYLFTLYPAAAIACPDVAEVNYDPADRTIQVDAGKSNVYYRLLYPGDVNEDMVRAIDAESAFALRMREQPMPDLPWPPYERPRERGMARRAVPPPDVVALARRITGAGTSPLPSERHAAAANAIEQYLRSAVFRYTLSPKSLRGAARPIEKFLLETREGYCQHFASAMTVLCQSVGVEARMVLGYLADEYNAVGQFYRVRKRDAHAWVEVRLPQRGWVVFDPTPASAAGNRGSRGTWFASMSKWYDYLQFQWASLVVTFDSEHRRELLSTFTRWWRQSSSEGRTSQGWFALLKEKLWGPPVFTLAQRLLYWLCVALIISLFVLTLRALWVVSLIVREHLPRRQRGTPVRRHPSARFYDRLLVQLARHGIAKPHALTPMEFARQLSTDDAKWLPVRYMTEWFYAAQYGSVPLSREIHDQIGIWLENLRHYGRFDAAGASVMPGTLPR